MNSTELVQSYRQQIGNVVNQANLQLFWNMYNRYGRGGAGRGRTLRAPAHGGDRAGNPPAGHLVGEQESSPRVQLCSWE